MDGQKEKFYIVEASALPEVYVKVAEAKRLISIGECKTIFEAIRKVDISRSTYYKYKDSIFEFYQDKSNIVTFIIIIDHISGTLSKILDFIAQSNANILTINQNIPDGNEAMVSISLETFAMNKSPEELLNIIRSLPGIKKLKLIAKV